jgi:hypothetical protein
MIADRATGSAPTTLPFWEEMDDRVFEEYFTALLNCHPTLVCEHDGNALEQRVIEAICQLGGQPQYGIDIRAKTDRGEEWVFQCKRVREFTLEKAQKVIADAESGFPKADHYVLVVTCGLSADTIRLFDRPKWVLPWDAARLTTETQKIRPIENGINLVKRFFHREDWVKRLFKWGDQPLLKWDEFFKEGLATGRIFNHLTSYIPPRGILDRLLAFAREESGHALILSAPGGQGKSRLLLELARQVETVPGNPLRVRFLNLSRSGLQENQADFLSREGDLLLIVDDAHRLGVTIGDIARAAAQAQTVRLLVATRPHALEAVRSELFRNGYEERLDLPLSLEPLPADDMLRVAEDALGPQHQSYAPRLRALADQCPLLVVLGAALIRSGMFAETMPDAEAFRERVFKGFKDDFLLLQPEAGRERLSRLIQILSFISPAPRGEALCKLASELIECSAIQVDEDLSTLAGAGLVLENQEGIRLYPDLFADAVLLDACLSSSRHVSFLCKTILDKASSSSFPALMRNVAQADWEARSRKGTQHSIFDTIWKQFIKEFERAAWPDLNDTLQKFAERMLQSDSGVKRPDRSEMLAQWASFSVYLPERTLELAQLAIRTAQIMTTPDEAEIRKQEAARSGVCAAVPPMLATIVTWHPQHARAALEILWSLDFGDQEPAFSSNSNPIAVIANAASFDIHGRLNSSSAILGWLEDKLFRPEATERIRKAPWILSALLKPFFERTIEHQWTTERAVHIQPMTIRAEVTSPFRQRALAIAEKYLVSKEKTLALAALPVVEEALSPIYGKFGFEPSPTDHADWRPDRLEALGVVERAAHVHENSPVVLLRLRQELARRSKYDADATIKSECRRVLDEFPDTFELRMARALTSWSHDEIPVGPGPNLDARLAEAERQWEAFCHSVAHETIERYPDARRLCEFLRTEVRELAGTYTSIRGDAILAPVAALSVSWCVSVLDEILTAEDPSLDYSLWCVLRQSAADAPNDYRRALEHTTDKGRPAQACSLINFLGWKYVHSGGLDKFERETVLRLATRSEEAVIRQMAVIAGFQFSQEPHWAVAVLSQLKPTSEQAVAEVLKALDHLTLNPANAIVADLVAKCFANICDWSMRESFCSADRLHLQNLARKFPKLLYKHLSNLLDQRPNEGVVGSPLLFLLESISLGQIDQPEYVSIEIEKHWAKTLAGSPDARERLALTRLLVWSNPSAASERLRQLIDDCQEGNQLKLTAELAAQRGSRFVFIYPELVRVLLARGKVLRVGDAIQQTLYFSACGGGRSFTEGELDPEYRYIAEQAQDLANRYKDDPYLSEFYRIIVKSERSDLTRAQQAFPENSSHF